MISTWVRDWHAERYFHLYKVRDYYGYNQNSLKSVSCDATLAIPLINTNNRSSITKSMRSGRCDLNYLDILGGFMKLGPCGWPEIHCRSGRIA